MITGTAGQGNIGIDMAREEAGHRDDHGDMSGNNRPTLEDMASPYEPSSTWRTFAEISCIEKGLRMRVTPLSSTPCVLITSEEYPDI